MLFIIRSLFVTVLSLFLLANPAFGCEEHEKELESKQTQASDLNQSKKAQSRNDAGSSKKNASTDSSKADKPLTNSANETPFNLAAAETTELMTATEKKGLSEEGNAGASKAAAASKKPCCLTDSKADSKSVGTDSAAKEDASADAAAAEKANASANPNTREKVSASENADANTNATANADDFQVLEFVLANQIEAKEPKEIVDTFSLDQERGFAFARISAKENKDVTFVWTRNNHEYARQTMSIHPSKKWRTNSSVKLRPGKWKVQLIADSKVLSEKEFTVE